ncbi:MAG: ATP-binding protein [Bacteroidota bacterium]
MRSLILIFVFLSFFDSSNAQKEGRALVDSMTSRLSGLKEDAPKVRLLAAISYEMRHIDPHAGLDPGFRALLLALRLNDLYGQGLARYSLALNYNYLSMLSESIDQSLKAAAIFEKEGDYDLLADTWFGQAQTYMSFDTAASAKYMQKAKALLPLSKDINWKVRNYGSLGNSYKNLDLKDSALKYINIHYRMATDHHMKWQAMMAMNRIGSMYFYEGKADSAFPLLKEALDYFKSIGASQMIAQNTQSLGHLIAAKIPGAGSNRGHYLNTAIAYGKEALDAATSIGFVMQILGSSRLLADLYAVKGDTGTSYKYMLLAEKYNEKLYGVRVVSRASMINLKNEERIKNQKMELLELSNRQQLIYTIASACGVIILIIIVLLIVNSRRRLKKSYQLVNQKNDEITRIMGELTDSYQALENSNRDLAATNQELEAFSYSVSHDMRAPVRRIEALMRILREDYAQLFDNEGRDVINRITDNSVLMNTLIDDMLQLSRITRQQVTKASCNLSEIAVSICEDLQAVYPSKSFSYNIEHGILVNADPHLLRIAMQNLLDNAFKYSSQKEKPEVRIRSQEEDQRKVIHISDNGAGFDMSRAGKLFTPFFRLHSEDQFKGTGIGLATVKRIILKHGGSISVQSEPEIGTTFSITL